MSKASAGLASRSSYLDSDSSLPLSPKREGLENLLLASLDQAVGPVDSGVPHLDRRDDVDEHASREELRALAAPLLHEADELAVAVAGNLADLRLIRRRIHMHLQHQPARIVLEVVHVRGAHRIERLLSRRACRRGGPRLV